MIYAELWITEYYNMALNKAESREGMEDGGKNQKVHEGGWFSFHLEKPKLFSFD